MIAETPLALSYLLPADVFFLKSDRQALAETEPFAAAVEVTVAMAGEPAEAYQAPAPVIAAPVIPEIELKPALVTQVPSVTAPVIAVTPVPATAAPATPIFTYQGGFAQKFLVIVNYPGLDVMEPGHLKALESTITRKGMSMGDVAIFNIGKYPGTDLKAIARFFKPKRMLLLGSDSFPIGLTAQPLNQLTLLGTCQLLYSDNFTDMMGNKDKTKAFWEQMKML